MKKQLEKYVTSFVGDIKANGRDFYQYINSQKKEAQGIPPLLWRNYSGLALSELEQAEEFNGQFTDVFSKSEHTQVPLSNRSAQFVEEIHVSAEALLDPSKALGLDELYTPESELGPINVCSPLPTIY